MQAFRIRKDAQKWFQELKKRKEFKIEFDGFYFCFVSGIVTKNKDNPPLSDTAELINYFPEHYSSRSNLLISLFLKTELEVQGISMDERLAVHKGISNLITPGSQHALSDEGVREFNKYAHGGFEKLIEWFDDRPRTLDSFLLGFKRKIDEYN